MVKVIKDESYINPKKKTVVTFVYDEFNNKFKGQSWCSDKDEFDERFGEKLAYLRAKRKMVRFHKSNLKRQRDITRKNMADFEQRVQKEMDKHDNVIEKIGEAISEMLD